MPSPHMYHAHGLATFSMVPPPLPWCGPMHAWLPWFIMPEPCLQTESLYTFSCQVACCTLSPSSAKYASLRRLKPHETPKLKQRAALPPWSNSFTQRLNMFIHMQDPKPLGEALIELNRKVNQYQMSVLSLGFLRCCECLLSVGVGHIGSKPYTRLTQCLQAASDTTPRIVKHRRIRPNRLNRSWSTNWSCIKERSKVCLAGKTSESRPCKACCVQLSR